MLNNLTCVATPVDRCPQCGRAFCENHRKPTRWMVNQWGQSIGENFRKCLACELEANERERRRTEDKRFGPTYITGLAEKELKAAQSSYYRASSRVYRGGQQDL